MWYVGDPCYLVDDDERWGEFVHLTFNPVSLARAKNLHDGHDHVDSVIEFEGQQITLWSNGGDGTWAFDGLNSANNRNNFSVDAGIFCVIDLANFKADDDPAECGILFEKEPELYVEDGVVYINNIPDTSVHDCENCGRQVHESWYDDEAEEMRCDSCW